MYSWSFWVPLILLGGGIGLLIYLVNDLPVQFRKILIRYSEFSVKKTKLNSALREIATKKFVLEKEDRADSIEAYVLDQMFLLIEIELRYVEAIFAGESAFVLSHEKERLRELEARIADLADSRSLPAKLKSDLVQELDLSYDLLHVDRLRVQDEP